MNEPERTEWQIRCAFNGFCKRTLKNESINAHKELRKRQAHEINFSDLTPKEENQLYTCEDFFAEDKEEQTFFAGGKELSAKLIADAIHSLPEEKRRAVLLYYFFDMSDAEIAALYQIPRSTVQDNIHCLRLSLGCGYDYRIRQQAAFIVGCFTSLGSHKHVPPNSVLIAQKSWYADTAALRRLYRTPFYEKAP